MQLTVNTFGTLNGVMQGPGGPEEDRSGGFERGGWLMPLADEGFGRIVDGWFAQTDALLLGRTTDELFAAYWPQVTDPDNGSHGLVQTLHDAGLVDEYRVIVAPVVVGSGKRLFEAGRVPTGFELVTTEQTATGCQYMVLRPAGGLEVATATVEDGRDVVR